MSLDNLDHYETAPEDAIFDSSGLYLLDATPQPNDIRLPNRHELDRVGDIGLVIEPDPLPTTEMLAEADIHAPLHAPQDSALWKEYWAKVNAFRDPRMSSRAWAELEDARITKHLEEEWDGELPVMGAGKHPFRDDSTSPPRDRGFLKGWKKKNGVWIQSGAAYRSQGPHNSKQADYSITTLLVVTSHDGTKITKLPLRDRCTGLFARLSIGGSEVAAKLLLKQMLAG